MLPDDLKQDLHIFSDSGFSIAAALGTALHKHAHTGKTNPKELLTLGRNIKYDATTPDTAAAYRQLAGMVDAFGEHVKGWRESSLLEKQLKMIIKTKGVEYDNEITLTGHPDRISNDGILYDIKTGRARAQSYAPQLGCYAMLGEVNGHKVKEIQVLHVARKPPHTPRFCGFRKKDCIDLAKQLLNGVIKHTKLFTLVQTNLAVNYSNEQIIPNPSSMYCTSSICAAFGTDFCKITKRS